MVYRKYVLRLTSQNEAKVVHASLNKTAASNIELELQDQNVSFNSSHELYKHKMFGHTMYN